MKTTLNIDDQILRKAKKKAASDGITLTAFVEDALRLRLIEQKPSKPYKYKPPVVEGTRPPNVDIAERDALYDVIDNS